MTMPTIELKPCPFCGKPARIEKGEISGFWRVGCDTRDIGLCRGNIKVPSGLYTHRTMKFAVDAWNRRAPATPQPKQRRDRRKCVHFRFPSDEIDYAWCAKYGPHHECLGAHGCPNYREGGDHAEA